MPTSTPNTIIYKGRLSRRYEEGRVKASGSVYPGMLVMEHTDGTLTPHATAGGFAMKRIVIEDGFGPGPNGAGAGVGRKITDAYTAANNDLVRYVIAAPGEMFYMLLKDGEVAVIGSSLSSNGDGKLRVESSTGQVLFKAEEALSPSGTDLFILCTAM